MARLGVDISVAKTHVSKDTYEFAKRWIKLGKGELTGLPLHGLASNIINPKIIFTIIFDYVNNGKSGLLCGRTVSLVLNLYKSLTFRVKRKIKDK